MPSTFGILKSTIATSQSCSDEPGGGLKAIGEGVAGVASLAEVGDEEFGDAGVVIDDQKLRIFAV